MKTTNPVDRGSKKRRAKRLATEAVIDATAQHVLAARLKFLATYEKQPPEIIKDDFAYDRLLDFIHEVASGGIDANLGAHGWVKLP